ncbi:MAG: NRDE family protein [Planctomycetota bacterium]
MCLLIVLRGSAPGDDTLLVAGNRDEARDRLASPPGLWLGERRRVLSPRDRRAGGTWLGVNDLGMVAGLTNAPGPTRPNASSRGHLPHFALDTEDVDAAVEAVAAATERASYNPFQLLVADGKTTAWVAHRVGMTTSGIVDGPVAVLTNEHTLNELHLPGLPAATADGLSLDARLEALRAVLLDRGEQSGHPVLKTGGAWGTVSSSLIAISSTAPTQLTWRYAPGPPDEVEFRNYGNLGRRLA